MVTLSGIFALGALHERDKADAPTAAASAADKAAGVVLGIDMNDLKEGDEAHYQQAATATAEAELYKNHAELYAWLFFGTIAIGTAAMAAIGDDLPHRQ